MSPLKTFLPNGNLASNDKQNADVFAAHLNSFGAIAFWDNTLKTIGSQDTANQCLQIKIPRVNAFQVCQK